MTTLENFINIFQFPDVSGEDISEEEDFNRAEFSEVNVPSSATDRFVIVAPKNRISMK